MTVSTDAPAALLTNDEREVVGVILDGTRYPLTVLRRALRHQHALWQAAQLLGFEDTRDEAAIVAAVRALVEKQP